VLYKLTSYLLTFLLVYVQHGIRYGPASVYPSQDRVLSKWLNVSSWVLDRGFLQLILHCIIMESGYLQTYRSFPLWPWPTFLLSHDDTMTTTSVVNIVQLSQVYHTQHSSSCLKQIDRVMWFVGDSCNVANNLVSHSHSGLGRHKKWPLGFWEPAFLQAECTFGPLMTASNYWRSTYTY